MVKNKLYYIYNYLRKSEDDEGNWRGLGVDAGYGSLCNDI